MTLNKANLIDSIYNRLNLPRTKSAQVIESLLEIIKKTLENGEDVLISGLGKFCVKDRKPKKWRNYRTGEYEILAERRVVVFRCSPVLKGKVNGEG